MLAQNKSHPRHSRSLLVSTLLVAFNASVFGFSLHALVERGRGMVSGSSITSTELWQKLVAACGGEVRKFGAEIPLTQFLLCSAAVVLVIWLVGSIIGGLLSRQNIGSFLMEWASDSKWLSLSVIPVVISIAAIGFVDPESKGGSYTLSLLAFFEASAPWFCIVAIAGCFAGWTRLAVQIPDLQASRRTTPAALIFSGLGILTYVIVFYGMNSQLYHNLLVPHGDSAMYEEHLWNVTHGKGFRSYLDQGLFLGEHIQVLHLALIPFHFVWPSHLTLELFESLALAIGAIPVFVLTRRMSGSSWAAACMGFAWLMYFPLHFLDVSIDLKTFRPISLGVPALMFALERLEGERYKTAMLCMLIAVLAKEDFATILAPLGLWIALTPHEDGFYSNGRRFLGFGIALISVAYVALAVTTLIPAFREGEVVHYTRYFGDLGASPSEIAQSILTQPKAVFARLLSLRTAIYAGMLLVPLGFMSCWSPLRLAVAAPLFGVLSLMQLTNDPDSAEQFLIPFHHFHAPLIPVIFWAAAGSLKRTRNEHSANNADTRWWPSFAICCATGMMAVYSFGPGGIGFWDSGSPFHHERLYGASERADKFEAVFSQIPITARVASTDFVHPRFTHHERSYDYSKYARRVSGYELRVPEDTDYIVIDTAHRYSEIKTPDQIAEYKDNPEDWELMPDVSDGYFIVLKRRK